MKREIPGFITALNQPNKKYLPVVLIHHDNILHCLGEILSVLKINYEVLHQQLWYTLAKEVKAYKDRLVK